MNSKQTSTSVKKHRSFVWVFLVVILIFVLWAQWALLDQVTRAPGQVIASSRNQVIQSTDGGVLVELPVKEGAPVKRGQLIARFDKVKVEASFREAVTKAAALKASVARLSAEVYGKPLKFPKEVDAFPEFKQNQKILFQKRQGAINQEIAALKQAQALIKQELEMNKPLLVTGDVSRADILKLERQFIDIQAQITNRSNKYLQDSQAELTKTEEDLAGVTEVMTQRKEQLAATELISPVDGIVRNIRITTIGGVAKPGEEIMQIVPVEDELIVEAKVAPADIAFIKPGLKATIKVDAYDYSIYGALEGEVSYISADTLTEVVQGTEQSYYRVQVKTDGLGLRTRGQMRIAIQPGMTATIEVKTGEKSVLEYLIKPITKTLSESLSER